MSQLERDGVLIQDTEPFLDLTQADLQDTFNAASVRHRIAIEPRSGQKTLTLRRRRNEASAVYAKENDSDSM